MPTLKPQEIATEDPRSRYTFVPTPAKPFVVTRPALDLYGEDTIFACLYRLQALAMRHAGLDYLQVFTDSSKTEPLWFIEDDAGGAITALLPSDY
jgi:hypothetical protein